MKRQGKLIFFDTFNFENFYYVGTWCDGRLIISYQSRIDRVVHLALASLLALISASPTNGFRAAYQSAV